MTAVETNAPLDAWVGRQETKTDAMDPGNARRLAAALDRPALAPAVGDPVPSLWHWLHFLPDTPRSGLGEDGHARLGGFLPPVDGARRMWAGSRVEIVETPVYGEPAVQTSTIDKITEKTGRSGRLVFVTVSHRVEQAARTRIVEQQDIVYRQPGPPLALPEPTVPPPTAPDGAIAETIHPDPVLLFRFSALTFNGHRIHYDRPYAIEREGYPALVFHGPLTALLLAGLAERETGKPLAKFGFRGTAPLFDTHPILLVGQTGTEDALHDATAMTLRAIRIDGAEAMTATATFR